MHQVHLNQCNSTQEYLKNQYDILKLEDENVLISSELQLSGKGRSGSNWHAYNGALAFSFSLKACPILTLTSLEIGVLISRYFEERYRKNIKLKWPNDLIINNGKCAGILTQSLADRLAVGVGINLCQDGEETRMDEYKHEFIFEHNIFSETYKRNLPEKIYEYIIENRLSPDEIIDEWHKRCFHFNQLVSYEENGEISQGLFLGIGNQGEALIDSGHEVRGLFSGSLRPIPTPDL